MGKLDPNHLGKLNPGSIVYRRLERMGLLPSAPVEEGKKVVKSKKKISKTSKKV